MGMIKEEDVRKNMREKIKKSIEIIRELLNEIIKLDKENNELKQKIDNYKVETHKLIQEIHELMFR